MHRHALLLMAALPAARMLRPVACSTPLRVAVASAPAGSSKLEKRFDHIWENTGWCPPDATSSAQAMHNYSMQEASWQNHAFISAVPNRGLKYVRIHDLLNLVTVTVPGGLPVVHPIAASAYNWTLLDDLLDMVVLDHGLRLGFEIMGNPRTSPTSRTGVYTSWASAEQLAGWRDMVEALASRYIARFGASVVALWRWETWNEPDHGCSPAKRMKANITCDQPSWLGYWDACAEGLWRAAQAHQLRGELIFGGPGSGGGTPTSWVLPALVRHLGARKKRTGSYGCSFIQWHNKGMLPGEHSPPDQHFPHGKVASSCNSYVDQQIIESVVALDPELAANLSFGNEEVDMQGGWSKILAWHADATNAAGILRILAMHEDMLNANATLQEKGVRYGYHANDNAFLNYGDAWFNQRTLTTRFAMNLTKTVEVVRKPSINTMAMLSLLTGARLPLRWSGGGGGGGGGSGTSPQAQPATPTSTPYGAIATQGIDGQDSRDSKHTGNVGGGLSGYKIIVQSVILWNSNGTQPCFSDCSPNVTVELTLPSGSGGGAKTAVRVYRMDEKHGNPNAVFLAQRGGKPLQRPYPSAEEFLAIRKAAELPSCNPLLQGAEAEACEGVSVSISTPATAANAAAADGTAAGIISASLPLPQPSVALVHACTWAPLASNMNSLNSAGDHGVGPPPAVASGKTPWVPNLRVRHVTACSPGGTPLPACLLLPHRRYDCRRRPCRLTVRRCCWLRQLRATTTPGEVFVRWADVETVCVGTWELFWRPGRGRSAAGSGGGGGQQWQSLIGAETLFSSFVHQQPLPAAVAAGCYKVRWRNVWGSASAFSPVVCVTNAEGVPREYLNA
jgi:hypothetical protein